MENRDVNATPESVRGYKSGGKGEFQRKKQDGSGMKSDFKSSISPQRQGRKN